MSSPYCYFIYGCEVPEYSPSEEVRETFDEVNALCEGSDTRWWKIGFHDTYDGGRDYRWWGVSWASQNMGFDDMPSQVPGPTIGEVTAAWDALPEAYRKLLGPPKALTLVGQG